LGRVRGGRYMVLGVRDRGSGFALASSGDPQFSREAVELLGIGDAIDLLTTSEDVDDSKPEPDLLGETVRRLRAEGAEVEQAVLVGDTVYDVESAARAGMACIGVRTGGVSAAELQEAGAALVAAGPAELLGVSWATYLSPVSRPSS
jgi:phosphoglycolate phosphatase-like HAD superfamily hydrolase